VAVSNCTAALHLCLLALDIKAGDAVAVTAYSWISTANVIELCGAKPLFVDIEPDTFAMNPAQLEPVLAREPSIKAILPVHPFGQVADMEAINHMALSRKIPVIEDAACALGSTYRGQQAGSLSRAGCFSFHPRKALTTGEGGMITTGDAEFARRLRALRNHGMDPSSTAVDFIMPGLNYRLTEFQAALGSTQLEKFDRLLAARKRCATVYDALLAGTTVQAPIRKEDRESSYQSYVVLLPTHLANLRGACINHMREAGIQVNIGTYHMPLTTFFRATYGYRSGDFPVADDIFARAVALPLYEGITVGEQERVVENLLKWVELHG
jgi:dTDP-4-amino-4,6-dideoxygalactose transaminase